MNNVRVGVGACIINNGKFLLGKRLNSHGANKYAFPGGHMEMGESWEETAIREVKEETGLLVGNPRLLGITNDIFKEEDKHYITIIVLADYLGGNPEILEPNKCGEWIWVEMSEVPKERFLSLDNILNGKLKEKLENELNKSK